MRIDKTMIFLNDFITFQVSGNVLSGLTLTSVVRLLTGKTAKDAEMALDMIQDAIEKQNRKANEPERNVRLKSITQNLSFDEVKEAIEDRLVRMGVHRPGFNENIPIQAVWTALKAVMMQAEGLDGT